MSASVISPCRSVHTVNQCINNIYGSIMTIVMLRWGWVGLSLVSVPALGGIVGISDQPLNL